MNEVAGGRTKMHYPGKGKPDTLHSNYVTNFYAELTTEACPGHKQLDSGSTVNEAAGGRTEMQCAG